MDKVYTTESEESDSDRKRRAESEGSGSGGVRIASHVKVLTAKALC